MSSESDNRSSSVDGISASPVRANKPSSRRGPSSSVPRLGEGRVYLLAFALGAVLLAAFVGYRIDISYRSELAHWEQRQSSIADEQAARVADWLSERQADAELFSMRPSVRIALRSHYASAPVRGRLRRDQSDLTGVLDEMAEQYRYAGVYVLDRKAQIVAQSDRSIPLSSPLADISRSATNRKAVGIDLVGDTPEKTLITFSTPIFPDPGTAAARTSSDRPLGVALLVSDAGQTLFPLLRREAIPTQTGETVLVRREGNEVVFFSPLRRIRARSPSLRFPLSDAPLTARAALEGGKSYVAATDYRGVRVLMATRRIPLTGWGLIRKIDGAEALEDFRAKALAEGLAALFMLVALGGLLAWHRREVIIQAQRGVERGLRGEQEKLRRSEACLTEAQRIARLGNWDWDIITNELRWSDEVYRIFGLEPQAFAATYDAFLTWVHPEDRGLVDGAVKRALETNQPYSAEHRVCRPDGTERIVQEQGIVYFDGSGKPIRMAGTVQDITERKRAEEALLRAGAYNRGLLEASLDPLVTISPDGKVTDVNRATEQATGRSRQELIGTDFSDYFTEPEKARAGYQRVFQEGWVQDYALEIRHRDGSLTSVLYNATVYRDETGEVIGVFAAARDVTETKRAQRVVESERERYNSILDRLPVYVVLLTPDYLVPFANRFFRERFGESHGRRCYEYLFNRTEPCEICESFKVLKAQAPHEWGWTGPDGRDYQIYDFPFADTDGSPLILEMGMDVTERKVAEEEIRRLNESLEQRVRERTAELEATNKELEAFTYSVSHDLRAPLRHVDGFSKLLVEESGPQLSPEAHHYLDHIRGGTRQMGQLVDDLLNLSRVGRRELSLQITGLGSLVEETIGELQAENPGRKIEWKIASLPFVECDPSLMKQVFANLLSNAVKFTRPRETAVIEVGTERQDSTQVVFVRDNGVGFSMKYADKLFGVFQRLHRPEDFEGTGVGLATVQRIIAKHRGRVWAEGVLDQGATFYFSFDEASLAGPHKLAA